MRAYITARNPADVARDVDGWCQRGCRSFVLRRIGGGGLVDQERVGAARYAAGLQADVELEGDASDLSDAASR
jgi:hypothetical protein